MRSSFGPKTVSTYLDNRLLRQIGGYLDASARLRAEWAANVQAPLGTHVYPLTYESGHLRLAAQTAVWASRARLQQTKLLNDLRKRPFFRGLRSVKIQVQPPGASVPVAGHARNANEGAGRRVSRLKPHVAALVRDVASVVTDPELRAALESLAGSNERAPTKTK